MLLLDCDNKCKSEGLFIDVADDDVVAEKKGDEDILDNVGAVIIFPEIFEVALSKSDDNVNEGCCWDIFSCRLLIVSWFWIEGDDKFELFALFLLEDEFEDELFELFKVFEWVDVSVCVCVWGIEDGGVDAAEAEEVDFLERDNVFIPFSSPFDLLVEVEDEVAIAEA